MDHSAKAFHLIRHPSRVLLPLLDRDSAGEQGLCRFAGPDRFPGTVQILAQPHGHARSAGDAARRRGAGAVQLVSGSLQPIPQRHLVRHARYGAGSDVRVLPGRLQRYCLLSFGHRPAEFPHHPQQFLQLLYTQGDGLCFAPDSLCGGLHRLSLASDGPQEDYSRRDYRGGAQILTHPPTPEAFSATETRVFVAESLFGQGSATKKAGFVAENFI